MSESARQNSHLNSVRTLRRVATLALSSALGAAAVVAGLLLIVGADLGARRIAVTATVVVVGVVTAFLGIEHVRETIDRLDDQNIDERRRRDESFGVRSY